jgi:hypothetical protein
VVAVATDGRLVIDVVVADAAWSSAASTRCPGKGGNSALGFGWWCSRLQLVQRRRVWLLLVLAGAAGGPMTSGCYAGVAGADGIVIVELYA